MLHSIKFRTARLFKYKVLVRLHKQPHFRTPGNLGGIGPPYTSLLHLPSHTPPSVYPLTGCCLRHRSIPYHYPYAPRRIASLITYTPEHIIPLYLRPSNPLLTLTLAIP
jgi:hypothetical protein